ncbi:hypothetical protein BCR32DRAFT_277769 [Anaeromyces robustus]|uniref:Uncharacterized protein n=1 Tax=Anaeromyces robustus TaxID=1754192 RepID=A0A1Y1XD87_9FUNG|nr:hypothetical protein BCR32DRAFT_277769 [Anaeromyces robustus]|eukprot:ORX83693.1 hypothetical protein BCR32DRAFT_277769 [Anaeromyces robustus]
MKFSKILTIAILTINSKSVFSIPITNDNIDLERRNIIDWIGEKAHDFFETYGEYAGGNSGGYAANNYDIDKVRSDMEKWEKEELDKILEFLRFRFEDPMKPIERIFKANGPRLGMSSEEIEKDIELLKNNGMDLEETKYITTLIEGIENGTLNAEDFLDLKRRSLFDGFGSSDNKNNNNNNSNESNHKDDNLNRRSIFDKPCGRGYGACSYTGSASKRDENNESNHKDDNFTRLNRRSIFDSACGGGYAACSYTGGAPKSDENDEDLWKCFYTNIPVVGPIIDSIANPREDDFLHSLGKLFELYGTYASANNVGAPAGNTPISDEVREVSEMNKKEGIRKLKECMQTLKKIKSILDRVTIDGKKTVTVDGESVNNENYGKFDLKALATYTVSSFGTSWVSGYQDCLFKKLKSVIDKQLEDGIDNTDEIKGLWFYQMLRDGLIFGTSLLTSYNPMGKDGASWSVYTGGSKWQTFNDMRWTIDKSEAIINIYRKGGENFVNELALQKFAEELAKDN